MSLCIDDGREFGRKVYLKDKEGQPRGEDFIVVYAEFYEGAMGYWVENADGHKYYFEHTDLVFSKPLHKEAEEMKNLMGASKPSFSVPGSDVEN